MPRRATTQRIGVPPGVEFHDERLRNHITTVNLPPLIWWRIQRKAAIAGLLPTVLARSLIVEGLGRLSPEEETEYRRHVRSYEDYLRTLAERRADASAVGQEPDPGDLGMKPMRPTVCPECGNDFAVLALPDGTASCGDCRAEWRWLPDDRVEGDYS